MSAHPVMSSDAVLQQAKRRAKLLDDVGKLGELGRPDASNMIHIDAVTGSILAGWTTVSQYDHAQAKLVESVIGVSHRAVQVGNVDVATFPPADDADLFYVLSCFARCGNILTVRRMNPEGGRVLVIVEFADAASAARAVNLPNHLRTYKLARPHPDVDAESAQAPHSAPHSKKPAASFDDDTTMLSVVWRQLQAGGAWTRTPNGQLRPVYRKGDRHSGKAADLLKRVKNEAASVDEPELLAAPLPPCLPFTTLPEALMPPFWVADHKPKTRSDGLYGANPVRGPKEQEAHRQASAAACPVMPVRFIAGGIGWQGRASYNAPPGHAVMPSAPERRSADTDDGKIYVGMRKRLGLAADDNQLNPVGRLVGSAANIMNNHHGYELARLSLSNDLWTSGGVDDAIAAHGAYDINRPRDPQRMSGVRRAADHLHWRETHSGDVLPQLPLGYVARTEAQEAAGKRSRRSSLLEEQGYAVPLGESVEVLTLYGSPPPTLPPPTLADVKPDLDDLDIDLVD